MITKEQALNLLWENPIEIGHWVGFKDLTGLHNEWLRSFLYANKDQTLQAHRGSYKTTTLSLFFAIHCVIKPNESLIYFRKTGGDVTEIARQTANILHSSCMMAIVEAIYGKELKLTKESGSEIQTNLTTNIKGSSQIVGLGIGTSITGKHADIVVTDDIVNLLDRYSRAERERTKIAYQELQNIKNRDGRFINTGTPWHKDDCFTLMPKAKQYDCYTTGLITPEKLESIKEEMTPALFAANYELRHIASEDVIFSNPVTGAEPFLCEHGIMHIDAAYDGSDWTAVTVIMFHDGKIYMYGWTRRKHVEDCYSEIIEIYNRFMCRKAYMEDNADKGFSARDLKKKGIRAVTYHESMNKYIKIATYLKKVWKSIEFVTGTDEEYITQICDYNENAEHDDCPDSAASAVRQIFNKIKREG